MEKRRGYRSQRNGTLISNKRYPRWNRNDADLSIMLVMTMHAVSTIGLLVAPKFLSHSSTHECRFPSNWFTDIMTTQSSCRCFFLYPFSSIWLSMRLCFCIILPVCFQKRKPFSSRVRFFDSISYTASYALLSFRILHRILQSFASWVVAPSLWSFLHNCLIPQSSHDSIDWRQTTSKIFTLKTSLPWIPSPLFSLDTNSIGLQTAQLIHIPYLHHIIFTVYQSAQTRPFSPYFVSHFSASS